MEYHKGSPLIVAGTLYLLPLGHPYTLTHRVVIALNPENPWVPIPSSHEAGESP
jgi:hypothetical protein